MIGDVDHNGRLDVVSTEQASSAVTAFVRDRDGDGYTATPLGTAGGAPVGLQLGDVDGDGRIDVVTANAMTNDVSVFLNRTEIEAPPVRVDPVVPPPPVVPVAESAAPVPDVLPASCIPGGLELVGVTPAGRRTMPRVRLSGVADTSLVGGAVRVLRNGRPVGTTTVRPGGVVSTTVRAPQRVRDAARARYQLVAADRRSRAIRARRIAVVISRTKTGSGEVQIRGSVGRVKSRRVLTVRATPFCGTAAPRARRIRSDRRGMFRVTLTAPVAGSPALVYRIFDGKRTVTLPVVVTAGKR